MKIGYARVSTSDQNIQSQVSLLEQAGCEKIYTDFASGVREDRPGHKIERNLEASIKGK